MSEEDFREIQLSGKQLVFLFMSGTVVLVVTFLLGVVVGRRVPAETIVADATGVTLGALRAEGLPAPQAGQPSQEPPVPVQEGPDQFSYHERLQQSQPSAENVKPSPPAPPAAAKTPDPQPAAPAGAVWFAQIGAYRDRTAAENVAETLKRSNFPTVVLPPTPGSPAATFRVRVGPFRERREAEAIAGRLLRELKLDSFVTR